MTLLPFHLPPSQRRLNTTARTAQSHGIASQMPSAPRPRLSANRYAAPSRNTNMEITEVTMANRTAPAARREDGSTKVSGQITTAPSA